MDDDSALNMPNWGYYDQSNLSSKGLGLQLMSNITDRDTKHFLSGHDPNSLLLGGANGAFYPRDSMVTNPHAFQMNYMRDSWFMNQREKFLNVLPHNPSYAVLAETSGVHSLQILQQPSNNLSERVVVGEDSSIKKEVNHSKKRREEGSTPKAPKAKKPRKQKETCNNTVQRVKPLKKTMEFVINGIDLDISGIPIPVCSCTGTPQQCYRWGCGGWQSACCTTNVSMYPLPVSTKRRGARIAGRKMSQGAFKKVLEKLAGEGYNFSNPIDLRTYWARHGTNKFVTIR